MDWLEKAATKMRMTPRKETNEKLSQMKNKQSIAFSTVPVTRGEMVEVGGQAEAKIKALYPPIC